MVYCLADQLPGLTGVWAEAEVAYLLEERHDVDWFELLAPQAQASWFLRLQMVDGSAHQVEIRDRSPDGVREATRRALATAHGGLCWMPSAGLTHDPHPE